MSTATKSKPVASRRSKPRGKAATTSGNFSPAAARFIAAAVADGLAIQHRFKAAPIYARTGKGFMAPTGVAEITAAKRASKTPTSKQ